MSLRSDTKKKKAYLAMLKAKGITRNTPTYGQWQGKDPRSKEIRKTKLSSQSQRQLAGLDKGTYKDVMSTFFRKRKK